MKAELKADGTLKISVETEVEAYALKKWWDDYHNKPELTVLQVETLLTIDDIEGK